MKKLLPLLILSTFFCSSIELFSFGGFSMNLFRMVFIIFTFLHYLLKKYTHKPSKILRKYQGSLCFFVFFLFFTVCMTPDLIKWALGIFFWIINLLLIYYIVYYTDNMKDLKIYMWSFFLGLIMTAAVSIYEYRTGNHLVSRNYTSAYGTNTWQFAELSKYPTAFLYNPNNVGVAFITGMSIGVCCLRTKKDNIILTIFSLIWCGICTYVAFSTGSRGAILCMPIEIFFIFLLEKHNILRKILTFFIAFAAVMYFMDKFSGFIDSQILHSGLLKTNFSLSSENVIDTRQVLLMSALKAAKDSYFIGVGPTCAERAVAKYFGYAFSIHNFWAEMLLSNGLFGLLTFIVFYIKCIVAQFKLSKKYRESTLLAIAMLSFIPAFAIPPTVLSLNFIWLIFGFALALEKIDMNNEVDINEDRLIDKQL